MRAAVYEKYGPPEVVEIKEVEEPKPDSNEVLIKVHATTVSRGDVRMRSLDVPGNVVTRFLARLWLGFRKPKRSILGMQVAGEVKAVGSKVTKFKVDDEVFASLYASGFGGHAEYKCIFEGDVVAIKPANMTFDEAASVPIAGLGAYSLLMKAAIQPGHKVLVYGASGSVGTFAVQIASAFGAKVTGVCSTSNHEMVKSLGAECVIDYTKQDFTEGSESYDLIFDAVHKIPSSKRKVALKENGAYISINQEGPERVEDLLRLRELIEEGKVKAVIDRTYLLEDIVEAHRYVDTGHKKGNVVIRIIS